MAHITKCRSNENKEIMQITKTSGNNKELIENPITKDTHNKIRKKINLSMK